MSRNAVAGVTIALVAGNLIGTPAVAQDATDGPTITIRPGDFSTPAPFAKRTKRPKLSTDLSTIDDRFTRGLDTGVGSVVTIEAIAATSGSALLRDLEALGLDNGSVFGTLVSGRLALTALSSAEDLASLRFMRLSRAFTRAGAVANQADIAMDTLTARATHGVDGSGISIGILSDSYDHLGGEAADIASGDLPSGVTVLDDTATSPGSDEGRAMAQLIHDIAPGANLLFHTAFNGESAFAQGILDLAAAGADVIVDDVGYFRTPMFQDGVVAQAVDQVVATGVAYFSAAGNSADQSYEAPYVDGGMSFPGLQLKNAHAFNPANPSEAQGFTVPAGQTILLSIQWDQPFASAGGTGASTDIDAFLFDAATSTVLSAGVDVNFGADAVEVVGWTNTTGVNALVGLVVGLFDTPSNGPVPGKLKWIDFGAEKAHGFATFSSTVYGHPNAAGAIAVGAAGYFNTPAFGTSPPLIEPFSSHGGLEILYNTAGNLQLPEDRSKPQVVAPDGVDTTFFGSDVEPNGFPNFFGTSAAAPHAAALAALQLDCDGGLTPADIEFQQTAAAIDMESPGIDAISGAGLLDAPAVLSLACPPVSALTCNGLPVTVDLNLGQMPTTGNDVIHGTPGSETINGLGGDDTICGGLGQDTLYGGPGSDYLFGGAGDGSENDFNTLFGGSGEDTLVGTSFPDHFYGQGGADDITGNSIDAGVMDFFSGGSGHDTMASNSQGGSEMHGNGNNDTIYGSPFADFIYGEPGLDELHGGGGPDVINGGNGADKLYGDEGDDELIGAGNRDMLFGGDGDDTLLGGNGNDTMDGGNNDTVSPGDTCNGQGQETIGAGDVAINCETTSGVPFAGFMPQVTTAGRQFSSPTPGRIRLTDKELRIMDRCDGTLEECLGYIPGVYQPSKKQASRDVSLR